MGDFWMKDLLFRSLCIVIRSTGGLCSRLVVDCGYVAKTTSWHSLTVLLPLSLTMIPPFIYFIPKLFSVLSDAVFDLAVRSILSLNYII
jgi:hypothetical protein